MDSKDIEKLNILLSHWIEHNESHIKAYNEWAAKLAAGGMGEVGGKIGEAAETIALANEKFREAKRHSRRWTSGRTTEPESGPEPPVIGKAQYCNKATVKGRQNLP